MSFQVNVKGHVCEKQAWRPLISCLIFIFLIIRWLCMQEIRKINFNYTHTYENVSEKNVYKLIHIS